MLRDSRTLMRATPFIMVLGFVASARDVAAMTGTGNARDGILWSAPSRCGSQSDFEQLLEKERIELPVEWTVGMKIDQADGEYVLVLTVQEPGFEGFRRLARPDCQALLDAAVVLLSLAVNQASTLEGKSLGRGLVPPRASPQVSQPKVTFAGRVGWGATVGPQPRLAHGPFLGAAFSHRRWVLQLGAYWLFPSTSAIASNSASETTGSPGTPQVRLQTWGFWPELCHAWVRSRAWSGCLGVQVSRASATGLGVTEPLTRHEPWIAPTLSLPLSIGARFQVLLTPAVTWAIARPRYKVEPYGFAFQPAPWGVVLRLEASWQGAER